MTLREITDLQLDAAFGHTMPVKVQSLVDAELNQGIWHDGYDIAVNPSGLDAQEGRELLDAVLAQYPSQVIDMERLLASVKQDLPQSLVENVVWMAAEDGTFLLTDGLRIARYRKESMMWVTPRISFDGVEFLSVDCELVKGQPFLGASYVPDSPFTLSFATGKVLTGTVIEE